jgi:hypothetical protein
VVNAPSPVPIDAVYTWSAVDSVTEREVFARRLRAARAVPRPARSESRVRDLGTLAWSVRGLLQYAPWIRTVHVITEGRTPPDLPCDPRIRVVPHAAFFRQPADLPSFNSYAIEANIGFVPGLAEHFVYFNDDMFLGRPATPGLFFDDGGRALCRFDDLLPAHSAVSRMYCRLRGDLRLSTQIFSAHLARRALPASGRGHPAEHRGRLRRTAHQAHAARASALRALWHHQLIGPEMRRISARPFRGWEDVCPFTLVAWLACHEGSACTGAPVASTMCVVRDRDLQDDLPFQTLLRERPALFCLNDDVRRQAELARARIGAFLSAYFADRAALC